MSAELLYGGGNTGKFQFNNVLNISSKTADGVVRDTALYWRSAALKLSSTNAQFNAAWPLLQEFTATSTQGSDSLATIVKAAYKTRNYNFSSSILPDGKVS